MTDLEEMSFRHLISQLQDENRQLREEVKWLRLLSIKNYLNGKKRMKIFFVAIVLIAIAAGLKVGFADGMLTFGMELILFAFVHGMNTALEDDDW